MFVHYLVIVYIGYSIKRVNGQEMGFSPCPYIFHYESLPGSARPGEMDIKGVITIPPRVPIRVKVHLQIPALLTSKYRGRLELGEEKRSVIQRIKTGALKALRLNLFYPNDVPLPHLIRIQVDDETICSSRPIPRRVKTNWSIEYSLTPVTTSIPSVNNNRYEWYFNTFDKPAQSNNVQYNHNPVINFPAQRKISSESYRPYNQNLPDIVHVDNENIHFENGNALKSDSNSPFRPLPNFRPITSAAPVKYSCGKSYKANPLIVNGSRAERGAWPWLVPLYKRVELGVLFVCGSTLITNQFLLTAAHCVKDHAKRERYIAYIGRFNLSDWGEVGTEPREISDIYIHPDYKSDLLYSDIALLKLQTSVTFSAYANPACIWTETEDPNLIVGSKGIVSGWGMIDQTRKTSEIPNMATLPIVSKEECFDSKIDFKFFANNKTFCAGRRDESGPCNGDSGGGLLIPRSDINGNVRWYLRGIVSLSLPKSVMGNFQCDLSHYIVFTDVAKFKNWLSEVMEF